MLCFPIPHWKGGGGTGGSAASMSQSSSVVAAHAIQQDLQQVIKSKYSFVRVLV